MDPITRKLHYYIIVLILGFYIVPLQIQLPKHEGSLIIESWLKLGFKAFPYVGRLLSLPLH